MNKVWIRYEWGLNRIQTYSTAKWPSHGAPLGSDSRASSINLPVDRDGELLYLVEWEGNVQGPLDPAQNGGLTETDGPPPIPP